MNDECTEYILQIDFFGLEKEVRNKKLNKKSNGKSSMWHLSWQDQEDICKKTDGAY